MAEMKVVSRIYNLEKQVIKVNQIGRTYNTVGQ
jgi:hypothetical protein